MDLSWFTEENIKLLFEQYASFGPLPGIFLTFIESFLPFLPLFLFVVANTNAFGPIEGSFYSWIGTFLGSLSVFWVVRFYGKHRLFAFLSKYDQVVKMMEWVEKKGFTTLFLLICFPFTPSAVVNVVAGLSKMSPLQYTVALFAGKIVMISFIGYAGSDITNFFKDPIKAIVIVIVFIVLYVIGKFLENTVTKSQGKKAKKQKNK